MSDDTRKTLVERLRRAALRMHEDNPLPALLREAADRLAAAPVCGHCLQPLACPAEQAERIAGLEQMHGEVLDEVERLRKAADQLAAPVSQATLAEAWWRGRRSATERQGEWAGPELRERCAKDIADLAAPVGETRFDQPIIELPDKHPLRIRAEKAEAERGRLRAALVGLVGADGREELEQVEIGMRLMPAPAEDKAASIDAIHALLATLPEDANG